MESSSYYVWQLVVTGIGVGAVIAYVIYTARLYRSYERNLHELQAANRRHEEEFKMSMRPWGGFKNITTKLSGETSMLSLRFDIKNFGSSPALKSRIYYYRSDRADVFLDGERVFSQFDLLPNDHRQVTVVRKCNWVVSDNRAPVYALIVVEYNSVFGAHWSRCRLKVDVGTNKLMLELFEMGDGDPPAVKTYPSSGKGITVSIQDTRL